MERRIVATQRTEHLFDVYKIYVPAGRPGSAEAGYLGPRRPVDALLEKYAHDTLDTEPPHPTTPSDEIVPAWHADALSLARWVGRATGFHVHTAESASWERLRALIAPTCRTAG